MNITNGPPMGCLMKQERHTVLSSPRKMKKLRLETVIQPKTGVLELELWQPLCLPRASVMLSSGHSAS